MEVAAQEGHEFDISSMFDRVRHPARGRRGGLAGAATEIGRDDGEPMHGKGRQFVPHGRTVVMAFPGGAGYGPQGERAAEAVRRDLALGYISGETAREVYGMGAEEVEDVLRRARLGEAF